MTGIIGPQVYRYLDKDPKGIGQFRGRLDIGICHLFCFCFSLVFEGDCPIELDATLGTKDDVAVVVLGIGEVLNSGEKPSSIIYGRPVLGQQAGAGVGNLL